MRELLFNVKEIYMNQGKCPKCGSTQIQVVVETDTVNNQKGFGCCKAIFGTLILGPLGFLCGLCGMKNITKTSSKSVRVCVNCGKKF